MPYTPPTTYVDGDITTPLTADNLNESFQDLGDYTDTATGTTLADMAVVKEAAINIDHAEYGGSLQAGFDDLPASGGEMIVPGALRTVTTPIIIPAKANMRVIGVGRGGSEIRSSTVDVFHVGTATARPAAPHFEGLYVHSLPGGGHCFASQGNGSANMGGLEQAVFKGVRAVQENAAKSIYTSVNKGMLISANFDENCFFQHVDGASVPAFHLVNSYGEINGNTWDRCWMYYSGEHFIHIEQDASGTYAYGNKIVGVVAEIMRGGLVKILSGFGNVVEDVINWDMAAVGASTRDWIVVGKSTAGPASVYTRLKNIHRSNGTLGGGLYDIKLRSGEAVRSYLDGGDYATLAGYKVDLGPNVGTDIRYAPGVTVDNMSTTTSGWITASATTHNTVPQVILGGKRTISYPTVPSAGTWAVGDRCVNNTPGVGAAKAWTCTVAGTPGTWVSEGNL